jgi:serine protease Do
MPPSLTSFFMTVAALLLSAALITSLKAWRDPSSFGLLPLLQGSAPTPTPVTTTPTTPSPDPDQARSPDPKPPSPATQSALPLSPRQIPTLAQIDQETSLLAAAVLPAVVSITTELIGQPVEPATSSQQPSTQPGLGSGVIVDPSGLVITNYHVVAGVDKIQVRIQGRPQALPASLLGSDPDLDVAVLEIQGGDPSSPFPTLPFGDSEELRVGQLVFAVGSPFGLSGTFSRGIISAKDRQLSDQGYGHFQFDAIINPGNSGGPVVDLRGRIIGIATAIYSARQGPSSTWQGVGLAIPVNDVATTFQTILASGTPATGFLGVNGEDVEIRGPEGRVRGVLVHEILPGSPADLADLRPEDLIVSFNGLPLSSIKDLISRVRTIPPGQEISLNVFRSRQFIDLTAVITERPPTLDAPRVLGEIVLPSLPELESNSSLIDLLAIEAHPLSPAERAPREPLPFLSAIRITAVPEPSPAASILRRDDLIYRIDDLPSNHPDASSRALALLRSGRPVALHLWRGTSPYIVLLRSS